MYTRVVNTTTRMLSGVVIMISHMKQSQIYLFVIVSILSLVTQSCNFDQVVALVISPTPTATFTPAPSKTPTITLTPTSSPTVTKTPTPVGMLPPTEKVAPTETLGVPSTQISSADNMELVFIPAGDFMMGASDDDPEAQEDEKPAHKVHLDGYWMDRHEVTNAMYEACVNARACKRPIESASITHQFYFGNQRYSNYPVIFVTWNQAQAYCEWAGRRLPTEAEWEMAASGRENYIYPWGNDFPTDDPKEYLNSALRFIDTMPVGYFQKGASPYGLLDMAGNVLEWVADWMGAYMDVFQTNPFGSETGGGKVVRGGSWYTKDALVRTSNRAQYVPGDYIFDTGFRCAMSP